MKNKIVFFSIIIFFSSCAFTPQSEDCVELSFDNVVNLFDEDVILGLVNKWELSLDYEGEETKIYSDSVKSIIVHKSEDYIIMNFSKKCLSNHNTLVEELDKSFDVSVELKPYFSKTEIDTILSLNEFNLNSQYLLIMHGVIEGDDVYGITTKRK